MHPCNFLRAFEDRFVYERDYFFPPARGITANRVSGRYWKTRKEVGQKAWKVLREFAKISCAPLADNYK
jgi:hypothetical protein